MSEENQKTLEELALEERREYFREWRANNKERVKKHNATYWAKRAKRRLEEKRQMQEGK